VSVERHPTDTQAYLYSAVMMTPDVGADTFYGCNLFFPVSFPVSGLFSLARLARLFCPITLLLCGRTSHIIAKLSEKRSKPPERVVSGRSLTASISCDSYVRGKGYVGAMPHGMAKWLNSIALHGKPISQLRSVTCRAGSHSVTCHPTQVNAPRHNPSRTGRCSS